TLSNVIVTDPLAPRCSRTSATIPALASLPPGASVRYTCIRPNAEKRFTNGATATGTGSNGQPLRPPPSAAPRPFLPPPNPRSPAPRWRRPPGRGAALLRRRAPGGGPRGGRRTCRTPPPTGGAGPRRARPAGPPPPPDGNRRIETLAAGKSTSYTCTRAGVTV